MVHGLVGRRAAETAFANSTSAAEDPEDEISWLGRIGDTPLAMLVICITVMPASALAAHKVRQRFDENDEHGSRRRLWKMSSQDSEGEDGGGESDGID